MFSPKGISCSPVCLQFLQYIAMCFQSFYTKGNNLWLPVCFPRECYPPEMGSTLTGKNLLLVETLPLKDYPRENEAKMKTVKSCYSLSVLFIF